MKKAAIQPADANGVDLKKVLNLLLRKWYVLVVGLATGVFGVFLINEFSTRVYRSELIFHISEKKSPFESLDVGLGGVEESRSTFVEKLIAVLKSRSHNKQVIRELELGVIYRKESSITSEDLYKTSPFTVIFTDSNAILALGLFTCIQGMCPSWKCY